MKFKLEDEESVYEKDISDLDATDFILDIIRIMRLTGYHDVSIWRALKNNTEHIEEYLDSITQSKDEWSKDE
jgi:hypothetical protein